MFQPPLKFGTGKMTALFTTRSGPFDSREKELYMKKKNVRFCAMDINPVFQNSIRLSEQKIFVMFYFPKNTTLEQSIQICSDSLADSAGLSATTMQSAA